MKQSVTAAVVPQAAQDQSRIEIVSGMDATLYGDTGGGPSALTFSDYGTTRPNFMSADGRYVVFTSFAPNLVPGQKDINTGVQGEQFDIEGRDIFLFDRVEGTTRLVSSDAGDPTHTGNRESDAPTISADGRFVAFLSNATNLVEGQIDTNESTDIFVFDGKTGKTRLVSAAAGSARHTGDDGCDSPAISANGRFIAFTSFSRNLVPKQKNPPVTISNVFVFDMMTGTTRLVSGARGSRNKTARNGFSDSPTISADGRFIAFTSASDDLIEGGKDTNRSYDVFVFDQSSLTTRLASGGAGSATQTGNSVSSFPVISANGRFIAFVSRATNLAPNQTDLNSATDVFVFDLVAGTTRLVSGAGGSSTHTGNGESRLPVIDADGKFIAFQSEATNLVAGQKDLNHANDIFMFDQTKGTIRLVSGVDGGAAVTATGESSAPVLSADGRHIAFASGAKDLLNGVMGANEGVNVFVFDTLDHSLGLVSRIPDSSKPPRTAYSGSPAVSARGDYVCFVSTASNLAEKDLNGRSDLFLVDRGLQHTTLITKRSADLPSLTPPTISYLSSSARNSISEDGRYVAFMGSARDLVADQTKSVGSDVLLYDRLTKSTRLVSGREGSSSPTSNEHSFYPAVSADGRFVAYLAPDPVDQTLTVDSVYVFDQVRGTTRLASGAGGSATQPGNNDSFAPVMSADGRFIAFQSRATNLLSDGTGTAGIYVFDQTEGQTRLIVKNAENPNISADGRFVVFESNATDIVPGQTDTNHQTDVFVFDRVMQSIRLVSAAIGSTKETGNGRSYVSVIDPDGRFIAFQSTATNLVTGQADDNRSDDVFVFELSTGTVRLVSGIEGSATRTGNGISGSPAVSRGGRFVSFTSSSTNLVSNQTDSDFTFDIFVFDREEGTTRLASGAGGSPTRTGNGESYSPVQSSDGRFIAFISRATDLAANQTDLNNGFDVFVFDRVEGKTSLISGAAGSSTRTGNGASASPIMSGNGRFVAFSSIAADLAPGDFNFADDVFLAVVGEETSPRTIR